MNFLSLIKEQQTRRNRLSAAQRLMAKAYRGVEYKEPFTENPKGNYELMYRGRKHVVTN